MNKKNSSKVIFTTFLTLLFFTAHDQSMTMQRQPECPNKRSPALFDASEKGPCTNQVLCGNNRICLNHLPNDKFNKILERRVRNGTFDCIWSSFTGEKERIFADYCFDWNGQIPCIFDFPDLSDEQQSPEYWSNRAWENKKRLWRERAPYIAAATGVAIAGATALCLHLRSRNMISAE